MSIFKAINNVLGVGTKTPSIPRVSSNSSTDRSTDTSQSQLITFQNSWHIIKVRGLENSLISTEKVNQKERKT
jgi:hypothetical protein